jgi:hypothetical protein
MHRFFLFILVRFRQPECGSEKSVIGDLYEDGIAEVGDGRTKEKDKVDVPIKPWNSAKTSMA